MNLKAIAAGITVAGTLGFAAAGLAPGLANAAPSVPNAPQAPFQQDGHGHGHWHGDDGGGDGNWNGDWGPGPAYWGGPPPPFACISGPVGWGFAVGCL
ncbi:MAG: hypothetical protein JO152_05100 [Mycobacteriaceae bacterium]|nr:hypothetical protein [Mycobacteriaceae bacterium]